MPHIRVRGLKADLVQKLSTELNAELARILNTSPDNFTLELVPTQFFSKGAAHAGDPFIEVLWFERTAAERDACARWLTEQVKRLAGGVDVAVVFVPIAKADYFENGTNFET